MTTSGRKIKRDLLKSLQMQSRHKGGEGPVEINLKTRVSKGQMKKEQQ